MDRKYVLTGLGYAGLGLVLGIYMASSKDHAQLVTHAHIMLLGFVVSFVYGLIYKLWLGDVTSTLAKIQYYTHQVGTAGLTIGLFILYGHYLPDAQIDPVLGVSSIIVFISLVLMKVMYIKHTKTA